MLFYFEKWEFMNEGTAHKPQKIQIKAVFFVIWEFMISQIP